MATIVSTANLLSLRTALNINYAAAYSSPRPLIYKDLCSEIAGTKKNVLIAIADMMPELREWTGDRVFNNAAEHSQLAENPHYELSMSVDADDIDDDELGGYFLQAGYLGEAANKHPDVLLAKVMTAATSTIGFDGQYYFDTDHPIDAKAAAGSQSNYDAGGKALTVANWENAKAVMGAFRGGPGGGRIIGSRPTHLVVPSALEGTARRILEADYIASIAGTASETNVNKGTAKVVVFDELNAAPTAWYALDLRSILKPFVFVKRKAPVFTMKNRPDDEGMFLNNQIQFGVDGRWGVTIGPWFRAYKGVA